MCCEFGPPDINLLGPPPKPPGASFNLECAGSSVLLHYDTSPFFSTNRDDTTLTTPLYHTSVASSPSHTTSADHLFSTTNNFANVDFMSTAERAAFTTESVQDERSTGLLESISNSTFVESVTSVWPDVTTVVEDGVGEGGFGSSAGQRQQGSSNGSTLNIVAIVLFSLAAIILIVCSVVLWYKRKVMLKNQINNEVFTEESQFLYNYRTIGKIWKLPRSALLINKNGKPKPENPSLIQISQEQTPISEDPDKLHSDMSLISHNSDMGYHGDPSTQVNVYKSNHRTRYHSSLERASSTTSGISSDGDPGSRVLPHVEMRHCHSMTSKQHKKRRRRSRHRNHSDDGDSSTGPPTGSEYRDEVQQTHKTSIYHRTLPPLPTHAPPSVSPHTLARFRAELCKEHVTPRMLHVIPKDDVMDTSQCVPPEISRPDRSQWLPEYRNDIYGNEPYYQEHEQLDYVPECGTLEPLPLPPPGAAEDCHSHTERRRKKRRSRDSHQESMGRSRSGLSCPHHNGLRGEEAGGWHGSSLNTVRGGGSDPHDFVTERRHNTENELRESYA